MQTKQFFKLKVENHWVNLKQQRISLVLVLIG